MICFHFSIFEPLETTMIAIEVNVLLLWFAFILVSLNHWKQLLITALTGSLVVICFHFSIFEPLETTYCCGNVTRLMLWFAFILVSLNHWKQRKRWFHLAKSWVVICFHFSIFEPLETTVFTELLAESSCDLLSF